MINYDQITKISVQFKNSKTKETTTMEYKVFPDTSFIKLEQPQGKNAGFIQVKGNYMESNVRVSNETTGPTF